MKNSKILMTKYLFIVYLIGVAIVSAAPLGGMSTAINEVDVLHIRLDYLVHALVFLPMIPLWRLTGPRSPWWLMLIAGLLLVAATEGIQYFLPHRAYNINDLTGNAVGLLLGALVAVFIPHRHPRK